MGEETSRRLWSGRGNSKFLTNLTNVKICHKLQNMNGYPTAISVAEARNRFSELIDLAAFSGHEFIIKKYGKPRVKIAPLEKADKTDPMSLAGVWDNKDGDIIAKYARRLRRTAKFIR